VSLANIFSVYGAVYVRKAFDTVSQWLNQPLQQHKQPVSDILLWYAGIILGAAIIRGLFMYLMRQSLIVMSRHIEYDLKNPFTAKTTQGI
jgi:ATP-binding cassette subfamily B protein